MRETDLEKLLVKKLKKGDYDAFDNLFNTYSKRLLMFSKQILKSEEDAKGVVQNVFLKIWEKRETLNEQLSFKSFLFTIAYNLMISTLRKKIREDSYIDSLKYIENVSTQTEAEIDYGNMLDLSSKTIEEMPARRKQVFKLSREQGLSNKEIAKNLNISVNTVENHITNALKFLRERIQDETLIGLLFYYLFLS